MALVGLDNSSLLARAGLRVSSHLALFFVLCGLLTIKHAWSRDYATSSVTAVLCFATAGPMLWNSLPEQLWQMDVTFRQLNDR